MSSSVLRGSISTKRNGSGAGGASHNPSQTKRQIIPENAFTSNNKEGSSTFTGQVCLSTLSETVRPPHLVGVPSRETREKPNRIPCNNSKLNPKTNNVSVINGQVVDINRLQSDIYKIYVQDSQAAATRLEMHKAQSHLNINAIKARGEKPFSPKNVAETSYTALKQGSI